MTIRFNPVNTILPRYQQAQSKAGFGCDKCITAKNTAIAMGLDEKTAAKGVYNLMKNIDNHERAAQNLLQQAIEAPENFKGSIKLASTYKD